MKIRKLKLNQLEEQLDYNLMALMSSESVSYTYNRKNYEMWFKMIKNVIYIYIEEDVKYG
jgi:hypothetical protein